MRDLLNYKAIASAGQPVDLTGEAIVQLGALLTQMDFSSEESEGDASNVIDSGGLGGEKKPSIDEKDYSGFGDVYANMAKLVNTDLSGKGIFTKAPPTNINNKVTKQRAQDFGISMTELTNIPTEIKIPVEQTGTVSPTTLGISAVQRLNPEVLKAIDSLRYKNKGDEDTPLRRVIHAAQSPFLQTEGVDYRQLKRAVIPEYAKGRLGAAAAEGFNLVIDKYNYDQAVKADYEQELDDEMGSLNVEADFVSDEARQNYLALGMEKKKRLADAFNQYANGDISKLDYNNIKSTLESEIKSAAAARTNLTKLRAEYLENKGTYDIDASDKEMVDFYNTLEKNPEALSIKNINGVDYVSGKTRGNALIKVPVSKIANGTAGFRLVENASLAPIMAGAEKLINKYQQDTKTKFGFGRATASPEKAKEIGTAYIKNSLAADENKLRSYMAKLGVDHTLYQEFVKADGAITDEMLNDAAEELYDRNIGNVYFQQTQTTRFATPKTGATTAGERTQKQIVDKIKSLGELNETSVSKYNDAIPPSMKDKGYRVAYKDGKAYIVRQGKKGEKSKGTPFSMESYSQILGTKPGALPILNK
jgi:hypothetical protein